MRPARLAIVVLLAFVGIIWLGQGLGLIGGGFMAGSLFWAGVGAALLVLALVLLVLERRRAR